MAEPGDPKVHQGDDHDHDAEIGFVSPASLSGRQVQQVERDLFEAPEPAYDPFRASAPTPLRQMRAGEPGLRPTPARREPGRSDTTPEPTPIRAPSTLYAVYVLILLAVPTLGVAAAVALLTAVLTAATGSALARPMLLISTENGPDHVQTLIVRRFVDRVRDCCADRIDVDHRFGGELYRDRDVLAALVQGKIGMAVAGTWQLDQVAPDTGAFMLPVFYGRTAEEAALVQDGPAAGPDRGSPSRILAFDTAEGKVKAPIVIGRDHLDSGSVASPYRETESMLDGSDAIADWPLLNALTATSSGATWVSIHHGGGVGIGRSIHAGQVGVADGTELAAAKLEALLTNDPGMGVIRHVDAGYSRAAEVAKERGVRVPMEATIRD